MELHPLRATRVANAVPGLMLAVAGVGLLSDDGLTLLARAALALATLVLGLVLVVRGYRLGVNCSANVLTVHGYCRTRAIPRPQITSISDFPAVIWRTQDDRNRWTPIIAFAIPGRALRTYKEHAEQCTELLRRWVDG